MKTFEHANRGKSIIDRINTKLKNSDQRGAVAALGIIARSRGMTYLAKATGLNRESLYRTLRGRGNPSFGTILKVMKALDLQMTITPASHKDVLPAIWPDGTSILTYRGEPILQRRPHQTKVEKD